MTEETIEKLMICAEALLLEMHEKDVNTLTFSYRHDYQIRVYQPNKKHPKIEVDIIKNFCKPPSKKETS